MRPQLKGPKAYVNWLRANVELLIGAAHINSRPIKLTLDPTNVCQLRCPLCPTGLEAHDRPQGHTSPILIDHLLDEVGDYVFFIDFFNWGEPLLNTHLEELIQAAARRKIVSTVSTNLSLPLTDGRVERLITSGVNEIIVSLDGASASTYARYRRRGNFDLVCENMRRLARAKKAGKRLQPLLTWQFLVFRYNEHEVPLAERLAEEIGFDRIIFRPPFLDAERFPVPPEDRAEIASWTPTERLYQIGAPADEKMHSRCGWHYMSAAINWDGSVAPCCTTFETAHDFGTMGQRGENSYMSVLNNKAFRTIRARFAGREKEASNLVCETCPTPSIMNYHSFLNRQVVLFTLAALLNAVRSIGSPRKRDESPNVAPDSPRAAAPDGA